MGFTPAVAEQRFVLDHVADLPELAADERFAAASPDLIEAVLEGAGAFAAGEWAPLAKVGDTVGARWTTKGVRMPDGYPAAYRAYVEGGWGTIGGPAEAGGQGLPFVVQTAVLETLGTANMAFALAPTLTVGAVEALQHHGSEAQRALWLPRLVSGEWTGTMNLTEPQAGSDVGALRTTATPRRDGTWSIVGTKIFISFGDHDMAANIVHLVLARTPDAPAGTRGISLFLVPKFRLDAAGEPDAANDVRVVSIEHKMGLHASPTCVMAFGETGECVGELVGEVGGGMRAMFTMMNNARLNVGLQGVHAAEAATQAAVAYARERVQSARAGAASRDSVAIVEHPDVRRMLMRMKAQTQAARALVYHAAAMVDRAALGDAAARERLELLTPLAKAHATDLGNEVASLGIQVHGGMGYIEETGVARFFRDARITPIYEGTNGIQAAAIVEAELAPHPVGGLDAVGAFVDRPRQWRRLRAAGRRPAPRRGGAGAGRAGRCGRRSRAAARRRRHRRSAGGELSIHDDERGGGVRLAAGARPAPCRRRRLRTDEARHDPLLSRPDRARGPGAGRRRRPSRRRPLCDRRRGFRGMSERARASLRAGPIAIRAKVTMTPGGLVATGALVSSILLATSVLVRVALREGRRTQQGPPLVGSDGPSVPDTLRGESG